MLKNILKIIYKYFCGNIFLKNMVDLDTCRCEVKIFLNYNNNYYVSNKLINFNCIGGAQYLSIVKNRVNNCFGPC